MISWVSFVHQSIISRVSFAHQSIKCRVSFVYQYIINTIQYHYNIIYSRVSYAYQSIFIIVSFVYQSIISSLLVYQNLSTTYRLCIRVLSVEYHSTSHYIVSRVIFVSISLDLVGGIMSQEVHFHLIHQIFACGSSARFTLQNSKLEYSHIQHPLFGRFLAVWEVLCISLWELFVAYSIVQSWLQELLLLPNKECCLFCVLLWSFRFASNAIREFTHFWAKMINCLIQAIRSISIWRQVLHLSFDVITWPLHYLTSHDAMHFTLCITH